MGKSTRSKWKKLHKRQRAEAEAANVADRVSKLHHKLKLASEGKLGQMPTQDATTRFHFTAPSFDARRPLKLPPMTTNPFGKSDPHAPHPQQAHYETLPLNYPIAGKAPTREDMRILEQFQLTKQNTAIEAPLKEDDDIVSNKAPEGPLTSHFLGGSAAEQPAKLHHQRPPMSREAQRRTAKKSSSEEDAVKGRSGLHTAVRSISRRGEKTIVQPVPHDLEGTSRQKRVSQATTTGPTTTATADEESDGPEEIVFDVFNGQVLRGDGVAPTTGVAIKNNTKKNTSGSKKMPSKRSRVKKS